MVPSSIVVDKSLHHYCLGPWHFLDILHSCEARSPPSSSGYPCLLHLHLSGTDAQRDVPDSFEAGAGHAGRQRLPATCSIQCRQRHSGRVRCILPKVKAPRCRCPVLGRRGSNGSVLPRPGFAQWHQFGPLVADKAFRSGPSVATSFWAAVNFCSPPRICGSRILAVPRTTHCSICPNHHSSIL
jgi:hypothetical protein